MFRLQLANDLLESAHIVCAVANHARLLLERLPAAKEPGVAHHACKSLPDSLFANLNPHILQGMNGGERRVAVLYLVESIQFVLQSAVAAGLYDAMPVGARAIGHFRLILCKNDGRLHCRCFSLKHIAHLSIRLAHHHRDVAFDDARFFGGNFSRRGAEKLRMVGGNVGNHTQNGRDDIGAIESAAQSHFNHGNIHLLTLEMLKRHCSGEFKKGGLHFKTPFSTPLGESHHLFFADFLAIHLDAFSEIHDVRRSVEPHLVALHLQCACHEVARRPLSIGACHMNAAITAMRTARKAV